MSKHHSSVAYVEPNDVNTFGEGVIAGDGFYDRAPDLEDYCIALDIEVELSSREDAVRENTKENTVIMMSYRSKGNGEEDRVSFMSGSKIQVAGTPNMLTSKYADMFVTDLVDYGTTEMIGIKSLDIEYNNACVPIITIKFTDVRGMSLFQPTELNNNQSFNGIRGFDQGNIAQSFFHAFFVLPLPKFTVHVKGFYGRPVSYEVMCQNFDASFNSRTGDFDVTAKFIGFAYSFMSDISFDALLAAPYSDYIGSKYWDNNVNNGRFRLPDKSGQDMVNMPKLYEIRQYFKTIMNESDTDQQVTTVDDEEMGHELEIGQLDELKRLYRSWYSKLYELAAKKYGKDFAFVFGGENDDKEYERIVILTNGKNITGDNLADEYSQYDNDFRQTNIDLYNAIEKYNSSSESYRKLTNVSKDFSQYTKVKTFNELWYNDRKKEIVFEGFHRDNVLPREETIKVIFNEKDKTRRLRKIYDDGVHQYIDAFVIEVDYSDVKRRINALIEDSNKTYDRKLREKKLKEHNRYMFAQMGWYPSIENFTKIVMAHLETLMAMMYDVIEQTKTRTATDLGISVGDDGDCCDVNSDAKYIPPFPRVTKLITDSDGITKREDAWVGNFNKGIGFKEVDMINGLFNAVAMIKKLEEQMNATVSEQNRDIAEREEGTCVVKFPLAPFDFFLDGSPYGTESDISNDRYAFAGKICMRMFDLLAINSFRKEYTTNWTSKIKEIAETEAENFYNLVKITNVNLMKEIGENGAINTGKKIIDIVTSVPDERMPWSKEGSKQPLFNEANGFWLERYSTSHKAEKIFIYPLQNMSFYNLENTLKVFDGDQVEVENNDIATSRLRDHDAILGKFLKSKKSKMFNTVYISSRANYIKATLENAAANGSDAYKQIAGTLLSDSTLNPSVYKELFNTSSDFLSSFNATLPDTYRGDNVTTDKKIEAGKPLYVGEEAGEGTTYLSGDQELESYFSLDIGNGTVNNGTITEVFGFKKNSKGLYEIDKSSSLFLTDDYYLLGGWNASTHTYTPANVKTAFFLMGIDCFDYEGDNFGESKTFCNVPKLLILQIGAVLAAHSSANGIGLQFTHPNGKIFENIRKKLHVSKTFETKMTPFLNRLNPLARIKIIRYFLEWSNRNYNTISKYLTIRNDKDNNVLKFGSPNCYVSTFKATGINRALLNQDSSVVKSLTTDLMSPIMFVRGNVNASVDAGDSTSLSRAAFKLDKTQVEVYLDSFLTKLRELLNIGQPQEATNNATTIAKEPSQTTEDMKIELYRYLKQVFDKWIPTTDKSEWNYETFFTESGGTSGETSESTGHLFHFIDSYYNKVGSKLLINPLKLADKIGLSTTYSDVNVMLFNFLAEVYAEHRCMMKCIQNFRDLSKGMEDLFHPIPYMKMGMPKKHPDFVVVYTYAASKNLNVSNSEFNDDGFMLNDELETPLAIRSRGSSDDESSEPSTYYKIPAFGVSYGRQYQSYFKDVRVDMQNPIMTQQAIIAKHSILGASRNEKSKISTSQDLYDIYTNQSYTCRVEMMGCAWIQPLMYFVLLNIPMFRGSYMIMKVTHRMRPGDMTTEIVGCRMANVSNRLVENIFTDETDENTDDVNPSSNDSSSKADVNNDCPYKIFPVSEDEDGVTMSGSETENAYKLMKILMQNGASKIVAAGIVGNMAVETGPVKGGNPYRFNPQAVNPNDSGYVAAGLCMWNDSYYTLHQMLDNDYQNYGHGNYSSRYVPSTVSTVKERLKDKSAEYQCQFVIKSLRDNTNVKEKNLWKKLTGATNPRDAAHIFCNGNSSKSKYAGYENPNPNYAHLDKRIEWAEKIYNGYKETGSAKSTSTDPKHNTKNFPELFFKAVQDSAWSSPSTSVNLDPTYQDGGLIMFKQKDGKRDKLGNVFDIILNGYYQYVQNLIWYYNNAPNEEPLAIVATVAENPKIANRSIFILKESDTQTSRTDIPNDPTQINEKFLGAIAKRYPDPVNNKILVKEVPQFRGKQEMLKDYVPGECPTCNTNGEDNGNTSTPSQIATSAKIKIDGWDVGKAVEWINKNSRDSYVVDNKTCKPGAPRRKDDPKRCDGLCATYVEYAIAAGGGPLSTRMQCGGKTGAATNLRYRGILEQNGFQMIESGGQLAKHGNSKIQPQAGDVCIIGRDVEKGAGGKYHACMWNGKQWVSDFKQNYMNVYNSSKYDLFPYAIYRFHNKQGTAYS